MATVKLNGNGTLCHVFVNTEILNTACVYSSPEIELRNVKWTVKFCKTATDDGENQVLGVYLVSLDESDSMDWACDALAVFKLFHKYGQATKCVVRNLPKMTFHHKDRSHGIDDFMEWDRFLQNYVHENQAKFEIEISINTMPGQSMATRDINQFSAKFNVVLENASTLTTCFSPEVVLQDVGWRIFCRKKDDYLGIFLDINDNNVDWSWKAHVKFHLTSIKRDGKTISKSFSHDFVQTVDWGYKDFVGWSEFVDNYIREDQANIFVELRVEPPKPIWTFKNVTESSLLLIPCCVCFNSFSSGKIFSTKCGHLFCKPCFDKSTEIREVCATCRTATSSADLRHVFF